MWWKNIGRFSLKETEEPELDEPEVDEPEGGGEPVKLSEPDLAKISADVLPEDLRNLPEAEIKFHLSRMVQGLGAQRSKIETLEDQVRQYMARPHVEEKPKEPVRPLEEEILEDPERAIMRVLEKTGLADRFSRVESQVGEAAYTVVASKVPEFTEHEDDVRQIMKATGVAPTVENIQGALMMAIGQRTLDERKRSARSKETLKVPKEKAPSGKGKLPELSGLEAEIFEASGMSREEWEQNKPGRRTVEVPTS